MPVLPERKPSSRCQEGIPVVGPTEGYRLFVGNAVGDMHIYDCAAIGEMAGREVDMDGPCTMFQNPIIGPHLADKAAGVPDPDSLDRSSPGNVEGLS